MTFVLALGGLGVLLLAGLVLRTRVGLLRRLYLPVPVIGGFLGLAVGPYFLDWVPEAVTPIWTAVPSVLINFVFAALFLGVALPPLGALTREAGPLFRFGVVTSLGQYVVGLALTAAVLAPLFGTPVLFACLLEVGFAGGHGTAAAMTPVFSDLGFEAGGALGQMSATVGIVVAVVGGMAMVQWGVRKGHATQLVPAGGAGVSPGGVPSGAGVVRSPAPDGSLSVVEDPSPGVRPDLEPPRATLSHTEQARRVGTLTSDVMDSLTFHVAVTAVAVLLGWVLMTGIRSLHPALAGFPLFPLAMVGGMVVQAVAQRVGAADAFRRRTFERILGLSLDLLVVAAIATLRLDLFLQNVVPFGLLMAAGVAWVAFAFLVLAPRMIPSYWFEQALTESGMQTGVTAVGLMLLRVVDPETRTPAARVFAAKQMIFSPLLGGGLVTATVPLLLVGFGLMPVLVGAALLTLVSYAWPAGRGAGAHA